MPRGLRLVGCNALELVEFFIFSRTAADGGRSMLMRKGSSAGGVGVKRWDCLSTLAGDTGVRVRLGDGLSSSMFSVVLPLFFSVGLGVVASSSGSSLGLVSLVGVATGSVGGRIRAGLWVAFRSSSEETCWEVSCVLDGSPES
jgi:hypothetical protein